MSILFVGDMCDQDHVEKLVSMVSDFLFRCLGIMIFFEALPVLATSRIRNPFVIIVQLGRHLLGGRELMQLMVPLAVWRCH